MGAGVLDGVKNKVRPVLRGGQWRATLNTMGPLLKSALMQPFSARCSEAPPLLRYFTFLIIQSAAVSRDHHRFCALTHPTCLSNYLIRRRKFPRVGSDDGVKFKWIDVKQKKSRVSGARCFVSLEYRRQTRR